MGQRGRASTHSSTEQSLSPAPPLPGSAPPWKSTPAPDTVLRCMLGMDPSSTRSLPSSACPAAAKPASFSRTSIHQTESWLSFLVPGVAVPPAELAVPKAARLPPMLLRGLTSWDLWGQKAGPRGLTRVAMGTPIFLHMSHAHQVLFPERKLKYTQEQLRDFPRGAECRESRERRMLGGEGGIGNQDPNLSQV